MSLVTRNRRVRLRGRYKRLLLLVYCSTFKTGKMKTYMRLFYIYLLAICFANTSCKKLIEVPPNPADRIATEQAFSDSTNVLNVMAGLYSNFTINDAGFAFGIYNGGVTAYTALTGDELINLNPNLLHVLTPYYKNSLQPDNAY